MPISPDAILKSLDETISHYRGQLRWLYMYSLPAIPLVFFAQSRFEFADPAYERSIFSAFYVLFALSCFVYRAGLIKRVHYARAKKREFLAQWGYGDLFAEPGGQFQPNYENVSRAGKLSPSRLYILVVVLFVALAILATWGSAVS